MEKKKLIALLMLAAAALVLIFNVGMTDGVTIHLLVTKIHAAKSVVLLSAISFGVAIGVLLK